MLYVISTNVYALLCVMLFIYAIVTEHLWTAASTFNKTLL